MTLLLRLLRHLLPPQHLCRHPDGCPTRVGPDQLFCATHRVASHTPKENP